MRYRVVQYSFENDECLYRPQWKRFLFWHNFKKLVDVDSMGTSYYDVIEYKTVAEAKDYIKCDKEYKPLSKPEKTVVYEE